MRKIVLTLMAGVLTMTLFAQKAKNNMGTKATWKKGGFVTLTVNQGGFDNWVPSGDADYSIGLNGYLNLYANREWAGKRKGKKKMWTNSFEALQAFQGIHDERTDENRFDKLEDRIDFISRYRIGLTKKLGVGSLAEARTQLYDTKRGGKRVSGFFAPATVIAAPVGLDWQPCEGFSLFLTPAAGRWIFVTNGPYSINQTFAELQGKPANTNVNAFGVNPDREVDVQVGAFASLVLNKHLDKAKKVSLRSRLDLYADYLGVIDNVDVFFTNFLSLKVNRWLNVGINLDMIYDDDVRQFGWDRTKPGLQYKHIIGVGAGFKF